MANSCTVLANLRAGRCSNVEEVRFLRFCEAKNINKRGQLMSLEMLLIDEHSTLVQGSVPASLQLTFRGRLTEGSVYTLSGFDVTRSNPKLRIKKSCHNEEAEPPCKLSSSIYYGGQEKKFFYNDYHHRYLQERWRGRRFQKRITRKLVRRVALLLTCTACHAILNLATTKGIMRHHDIYIYKEI
ncbi:uncharacterized protein LOC117126863 [Brassica rapa]|uniref:uncharacterized protein LOC117126863 n=1 Tax=Brassica campestris TaxID=3711 RepID=UPI00142E19B6|nr:uncharacterized protein LOC117126863 [Brassica rapa]